VIMPLGAQQVADAIPAWLKPFVRVIDGDLIRERVIECDYREDKWSDVTTREVDLPVYGADPAIAIDSFILTGWGPRETAAEIERRESLESAARDKAEVRVAGGERFLWLACAIVAVIGSAFLIQSGVSPVLSVLVFALGASAALNTLRLQARFIGFRAWPIHYIVAAACWLGLAVGVGRFFLGLRYHDPDDLFLGILLLGISITGCALIPRMLRKDLSKANQMGART
jgi:hypothetical protein